MELFDEICDIIKESAGMPEQEAFTEEMTFAELGLDSLDMVEGLMALEDFYSIEITDEELEEISTLGELTQLIKEKKGM